MIITRRPTAEFVEQGFELVQATDVAAWERRGVPLYTGVISRERPEPAGPWAPGWAVMLYRELLRALPWSLDNEVVNEFTSLAVRVVLLQDDPDTVAQAVCAAARAGGQAAVSTLLEALP